MLEHGFDVDSDTGVDDEVATTSIEFIRTGMIEAPCRGDVVTEFCADRRSNRRDEVAPRKEVVTTNCKQIAKGRGLPEDQKDSDGDGISESADSLPSAEKEKELEVIKIERKKSTDEERQKQKMIRREEKKSTVFLANKEEIWEAYALASEIPHGGKIIGERSSAVLATSHLMNALLSLGLRPLPWEYDLLTTSADPFCSGEIPYPVFETLVLPLLDARPLPGMRRAELLDHFERVDTKREGYVELESFRVGARMCRQENKDVESFLWSLSMSATDDERVDYHRFAQIYVDDEIEEAFAIQ